MVHKLQVRGLTVKDVAAKTQLDEHTLYRMIKGDRVQTAKVQIVARYIAGVPEVAEASELIAPE